MINHTRILSLAAISLAALALASTGAHAGAFGVREQSATAQGYSFAGAASGSGGLSSMFWNPATITMAPGWQAEFHASFISPEVKIKPTVGTSPLLLPFGGSGDIGQDAVVPTGYLSYQFNDYLWLGLASTAPFGLVTNPRLNWAGQVYSRSSRIFSANVNPVVGVKVNNWLSFAVGPTFEFFDVRLKRAVSPLPNAPNAILEGDDWGFGFTAGVNITPFAGTAIGIGYRSSVNHEVEGTLTAPGLLLPIRASLNTPDMVTVGLSQAITPALTVHAGFEWSNWSRLKTPGVVGPGDITVSALPLNYEDGYLYSLGMDYRLTDRWTLRAGLAFEQSPIDTHTRSTRLPDNDRFWLSIGAGYQWNQQLSFDVAYTHIITKDTRINIGPGHQDFIAAPIPLPFVADVDSSVNIISAAIRYRWDNPAQAIPAPIVRKY